eukprot:1536802-Pyramimonas_sp.AAC.1
MPGVDARIARPRAQTLSPWQAVLCPRENKSVPKRVPHMRRGKRRGTPSQPRQIWAQRNSQNPIGA